MNCTDSTCSTPPPTVNPYSVLPNPDDWPDPPEWMFSALYVLIVLMAVIVAATLIVAFVYWRRRAAQARVSRSTQWVDLDEVFHDMRGGVSGARQEATTTTDSTDDAHHAGDADSTDDASTPEA